MSATFSFSNLSPSTRSLLEHGLSSAKEHGLSSMPIWMLLALLYQSDDPTSPQSFTVSLRNGGLDQDSWIADIEQKIKAIPRSSTAQISLDNDVGAVLLAATSRAAARREKQISTEDIWIEILLNKDVAQQFEQFGVDQASRREILRLHGVTNVAEIDPSSFIAKYCRDLTEAARTGELDPVVGRDEEIREGMNILQRRFKNNPVFVGEPGVGKTALVEGLAQRMVKNEVPESLKNKSLMSLDLGALIAGARAKGELEERVRGLVKEIQDREDIVLFIDEIHTLVSGDASSVGQLLKPALARGELRCIGATTPDEYRVNLEKDPALERRFEKIPVLEPSIDEAIAILRGVKDRYSLHHGVDITDQALVAAVQLSHRYMTDRQLPDKAIDLIDTAAARQRTILDSKPEQIDRLERSLLALRVERDGIEKERESEGQLSDDTQKQLEKIEQNIEQREKEIKRWEDDFSSEKSLHDKVIDTQKKIQEEKVNLQSAQSRQDLGLIGKLQFGIIPDLEQELKQAKKDLRNIPNRIVDDQVTAESVSEIVSRRTGIPVNKMQGGEQERLAKMEEILNKEVIGQPAAVETVSDAVRRNRSGLGDPKRPIGSFMFAGSSGVGKTELCKVLSNFMFDKKDSLVRIDMSEFMEKQSVSRLVGPPPGYVGYEEGGMLTEAIRQNPYSVILCDEVEKAHPDVFNVFLQLLDEGRLTDGHGRTVNFNNTIVIMTSNLASSEIQQMVAEGRPQEEIDGFLKQKMHDFFRPEFINRLDEIVAFHPLDRDDIAKIAVLQTNSLIKRLKERKIDLVLSQSAIDHLATAGFDPTMGARPLKRAIQQELENPLAKDLVSGAIKPGSKVTVDAAGGKLSWSSQFVNQEEFAIPPDVSIGLVSEKLKRSVSKSAKDKKAAVG